MTWIVAGPPRSATTFMMESLVAWTTLRTRWDLKVEWQSRNETGLRERFWEGGQPQGDDTLIKCLNPNAELPDIQRAILMIRDPREVSISAWKLGQKISPAQVEERVEQFRDRFFDRDEVHVEGLVDIPGLMDQLKSRGWPVVGPSYQLVTKAVR